MNEIEINGEFTYVEKKAGIEKKITYVAYWSIYYDDYTRIDIDDIDAEGDEVFLDTHYNRLKIMCQENAYEHSPGEERELTLKEYLEAKAEREYESRIGA